jgi:hypothetical protein
MRLPWRDADGRVLTAEELYADALAHRPERFRLHEQRVELWRWVQDEASFSAAAEWIDDQATRRRARLRVSSDAAHHRRGRATT